MDPGPVLIEETRDGRVQAIHHGHWVRLGADGGIREARGDPAMRTYWRSAPKPLQAIPLAEVLDRLALDDRSLALACASHSGEADHLAEARRILAAAGLESSALQCASHPRMTKHSVRAKGGQTALHNNCSGKHAGWLAACQVRGWPIEGYLAKDHPLQQRILDLLEQAIGRRPETGGDGCGAPTFWASLAELARAYQWLDGHDIGRRCLDAMAAHPWLVAGTDRFCTLLGQASGGRCVGKVGAAGLYVVLHRPSGEAIAVKASDGQASVAETLAASLVERLGWVAPDALQAFSSRPVTDCAGRARGAFCVL